mmetsp:Transcript_163/g.378  ORF Transcript_163/g.378 Transcript_163/m.378 type:complete len:233 (-) Transcript_163:101-799(-)
MESVRSYTAMLFSDKQVTAPVKNTFIHFNVGMDAEEDHPRLRKSNSDPVDFEEGSRSGAMTPLSESSIAAFPGNGFLGGTATPASDSGVEPAVDILDLDPALASVGARFHKEGKCKPCAWNWKPTGCVKSRGCTFCHECGEGELKRRKRDHVAHLRAKKVERRRSGMGSDNSDATSTTSGMSSLGSLPSTSPSTSAPVGAFTSASASASTPVLPPTEVAGLRAEAKSCKMSL